jgi:hypothetical protein
MFMLYAVAIGLLAGRLLGGRVSALGELKIAWLWLGIFALGVQVVLFVEPFMSAMGELLAPLYVASTILALAVVVRNIRRLPGLAIVALGTVSNLVAIVSNGGYMPVTPEAMGAPAPTEATHFVNAVFTPHPAFEPLVDRWVLPEWLPFSNVFSIGDVLISVGMVIVIVVAMRQRPGHSEGGEPMSSEEQVGPAGGSRRSAPVS